MIRLYRLTVIKFIQAFLPPLKRQTNRLLFYDVIAFPFTTVMNEFITWRDKTVTKANVTGETGSIEGYLNYLFDPTLQRITITTATRLGLPMGIRDAEPAFYQSMGVRDTEPTFYQGMRKRGESSLAGTKSFIVSVPAALSTSQDAIAGVVSIYKPGGKTFQIVLI